MSDEFKITNFHAIDDTNYQSQTFKKKGDKERYEIVDKNNNIVKSIAAKTFSDSSCFSPIRIAFMKWSKRWIQLSNNTFLNVNSIAKHFHISSEEARKIPQLALGKVEK